MGRDREYRMISSPLDAAHTLLPARLVCEAEGFAMVRRRGGTPFVVEAHAWAEAPLQERGNS